MRNSSTPPLLRLEDICVKFGFVEALKSVNLSIQRQEVIAIVAPREIRNNIMEAVNREHGLQSEARAMVCALGIDQLVHLG